MPESCVSQTRAVADRQKLRVNIQRAHSLVVSNRTPDKRNSVHRCRAPFEKIRSLLEQASISSIVKTDQQQKRALPHHLTYYSFLSP